MVLLVVVEDVEEVENEMYALELVEVAVKAENSIVQFLIVL
ncbi:MAG: hypothetical protein R2852_08245 [Bacteroidia bacterium]